MSVPTLIMTMRSGKEIEVPSTARANLEKQLAGKIQGFRLKDAGVNLATALNQPNVVEVGVTGEKLEKSMDLKGIKGSRLAIENIKSFDTIAEVEEYTEGETRKSILKAVELKLKDLNQ